MRLVIVRSVEHAVASSRAAGPLQLSKPGADDGVGKVRKRWGPAQLSTGNWDIEVFYDGECPLCRREIEFLRKRDRHRRIRFTDIASPSFSAEELGKTHEDLMARIQGRLPTGEWIDGVEVFRRLYSAVGFGALVGLSRLPVISPGLDLAYRLFARNRLRLTGRCDASSSCRVDT